MHLDDAARPDPRRRGQTDDLTFSIAGMTASKTATKSLRQTLLCRIVRGQAMPCLSSQSTATSGCLSQELGMRAETSRLLAHLEANVADHATTTPD